jgi:hypothetical protein
MCFVQVVIMTNESGNQSNQAVPGWPTIIQL